VLVILPEGFGPPDERETIEEAVRRILSPYDTWGIDGEYNERGFYDGYDIGGAFDGAVNGMPNYYHEALTLSGNNPHKDYGILFRQLALEELKRNSCRVDNIRFPAGEESELPERVVLPDCSVKVMPQWFIFPDMVRTADGKLREGPILASSKTEAKVSREAWDQEWERIVRECGKRLAVGIDCHL
jgi:hypothetical protein